MEERPQCTTYGYCHALHIYEIVPSRFLRRMHTTYDSHGHPILAKLCRESEPNPASTDSDLRCWKLSVRFPITLPFPTSISPSLFLIPLSTTSKQNTFTMLSALRPIARPLAGSLRTRIAPRPSALKFSALRFVSTSAYRPPSHWSESPLVIELTFSSPCHSFHLTAVPMRTLQSPIALLSQPSTLLTTNGSLLSLRPTSVSLVSPSTPRRL